MCVCGGTRIRNVAAAEREVFGGEGSLIVCGVADHRTT